MSEASPCGLGAPWTRPGPAAAALSLALDGASPCGLLGVDHHGRLAAVSEGTCRLTGSPLAALVGGALDEVFVGAAGASSRAQLLAARPDGGVVEAEHQRLDGTRLRVQLRGMVIEDHELSMVVRALPLEVAALQAHLATLEARRDQLERLQQMEAMATLVGGVAHDFNNLIGGVLGHASILDQDLGASSPLRAEVQGLLGLCERARKLVAHLRGCGYQVEGTPGAVEAGPLIEELCGFLRSMAPPGVEVRAHLEAADAHVLGESAQLDRVLTNLGVNALHALEAGGGLLEVRLRRAGEAPDSPVLVEVEDTGPGIPLGLQEKVFDPFFTTKPPGRGTGLGLAVCREVVTAMGGAIELESAPGEGCLVRLRLPATSPEDPPASTSPVPDLRRGPEGPSVMVVEDEPAILRFVARTLTGAGHSVESCTRGRQALARLKEAPGAFDLLITDLGLPGFSGADLLRELRACRVAVPTLLMTGCGELPGFAADLEVELRGTLAKPFHASELLGALAVAMGPRRQDASP